MIIRLVYCLFFILLSCCSDDKPSQSSNTAYTAHDDLKQEKINDKQSYIALQQQITSGTATIQDVHKALTDKDVGRLTNTIHALYAMSWHRGVHHLLRDIWYQRQTKHPQLAWEALNSVPVRIALASTINREQIFNTEEYREYIRSHRYDDHEFHRAQVAIALGLNGDPKDVAYLKEMADTDNVYVSQSAITALAMLGHNTARDAMSDLWLKHKETPKGFLIKDLLKQAYRWGPFSKETNTEL